MSELPTPAFIKLSTGSEVALCQLLLSKQKNKTAILLPPDDRTEQDAKKPRGLLVSEFCAQLKGPPALS
jgi:hypothetical protein